MSYLTAFQDGILAAQAGKRMIARLQFEQVVQLAPDFVPGHFWLAWTADSPAQVAAFLDRIDELDPDNALLTSFRQVATAFETFQPGDEAFNVVEPAPDSPSVPQPTAEISEEATDETAVHADETAADDDENQDSLGTDTVGTDTVTMEILRAPPKSNDTLELSRSNEDTVVGVEQLAADVAELTVEIQSAIPFATTTNEPAEDASSGDADFEFNDEEKSQDAPQETDEVDAVSVVQATPTELEAPQPEATSVEVTSVEATSVETQPSTPVETPRAAEPEKPAGPTILAVDDSPTVRKLVAMTLESAGYQVETAEDGVEAMKLLATTLPNLILLDVNMPRMDGYKLCKLLKQHEKTKSVPVVMLSGKDGMFDKLRGKMVGCDDYISKPFRANELLKHIERYVAPVAR